MIKQKSKFNKILLVMLVLINLALLFSFVRDSNSSDGWQMVSYGGGSHSPDIAVKSDGNPCVTWSSDKDIYLRCWDGKNWVELGGSASNSGISNDSGRSIFPTIAIDGNDTIYVAWANQEENNNQVYIRKWNGEKWEEIGSVSASGVGISENGRASAPDLAIASDGTLYVVWHHRFYGSIYGKKWNGTNWLEIGEGSTSDLGISDMDGHSQWPTIEVDSNGKLFVVWHHEIDDESGIYAKVFDQTEWKPLGKDSITTDNYQNTLNSASEPEITFAQPPFVAWENDDNIFVRHWDGSKWIDINNPINGGFLSRLFSNRYAQAPHVVTDSENQPYVTWPSAVKGESYDIYVLYWDNNNWVEVGHNSAQNGGVSNNDGSKPGGHSWNPSITLGKNDQLFLAWEDQRSGITEIFVRHWNGDQWDSVGIDGDAGRYEDTP